MESGQTPLYLSDDYVEDGKYFQSDVEEPTGQINKPAFIRLNPLDNTVPITFNLNTKCHKCALVDDNDVSNSNDMNDRAPTRPDNLIIIVFTNKRDLPTSQYNSLKLSMIFPYTCPLIKDGIGCLRQSDLIEIDQDNSTEMNSVSNKQSLPELRSESSLLNIPVIEQLKTMTFIQTESKHTLSLSIILIIWCTIITISFIVVILIVLYCVKQRFIKIPLSTKVTQITPFSLFHVCVAKRPINNGTDVFILMIDNKPKSVRNLPHTNPIRQLLNPVNKQDQHMKGDWKHSEVPNGSVI
ncbi:hypothetical protein Smp_119110 [Schistosoma mansoni]|uniref:hypothetical protein n=1 Tax=Schistosoma mansoni TaxID=6183 RepID=UPI00019B3902|nr:hypothetical protein Smp_119110 [Schistosoma mansoni]|eukprot:XP_018654314.1 hypothetical protein Smp_119110 [Schistosoma mansoni]